MVKFIGDLPQPTMNNNMTMPPMNNSNNNNDDKNSKKNQIYILIGVAIAAALVMGLIFLIIDSGEKKETSNKNNGSNITEKKEETKTEEPKKEEPKEEPTTPSEPTTPDPEPQKEERKQYKLTCKQQNGFYSYVNTFTFDKDKDKVIEVNNKFYIPAYGNQDTHSDTELANIKSSAKSTEMMIMYLNLDKGAPGITINKYDTSNDTLDLDITFIESEIQDQDVYNFAFGPIKSYTFQTMYDLDKQYDMCSIS